MTLPPSAADVGLPDADATSPAEDGLAPATREAGPALAWVTPESVRAPAESGAMVAPDLLSALPIHRSRALLAPLSVLGVLTVGYLTAAAVWPLDAIAPRVSTQVVSSAAQPQTAIAWPVDGSAGIGIADGVRLSSTTESTQMASITKVITVMTVLDARPMELGETGPEYTFTQADSDSYYAYLNRNESALDVPVDGVLTEYQLIEGILLGSAGNYTDFLASTLWDSDAAYVAAANAWMAKVGLIDITVVEPTGIDYGNMATPDALVALAEIAMRNPVVAEIAAKPSADIPGAGLVENSNGIINDPGVVGLKTGSLDYYNLLSAKNITVGDVTVKAYAVSLDQRSYAERDDTSRALYAQLEEALAPQVAVPKGTVVANVSTVWGERATISTDEDASVVLWQREAEITKSAALGDDRAKGASAGSLTVTGTTGEATVALKLDAPIPNPSYFWRLLHPLELLGIGS